MVCLSNGMASLEIKFKESIGLMKAVIFKKKKFLALEKAAVALING